jgi:hypothetical protein
MSRMPQGPSSSARRRMPKPCEGCLTSRFYPRQKTFARLLHERLSLQDLFSDLQAHAAEGPGDVTKEMPPHNAFRVSFRASLTGLKKRRPYRWITNAPSLSFRSESHGKGPHPTPVGRIGELLRDSPRRRWTGICRGAGQVVLIEVKFHDICYRGKKGIGCRINPSLETEWQNRGTARLATQDFRITKTSEVSETSEVQYT